jgi:hypothetical protein
VEPDFDISNLRVVSHTTKSTVTDCSDYVILPLTEKSIYVNQLGYIETDDSEENDRQDFRANIIELGIVNISWRCD